MRFVAYLSLLGKDIKKQIFPLPAPGPNDILDAFPRAKKSTPWLKKNDLWGFKKQTKESVIAFALWSDHRARNITNVGLLYELPRLHNFLAQKLHLDITAEVLRIYERVFFDVNEWDFEDWGEYVAALNSQDLFDQKILKLWMEDSNVEYILKLLGINSNEIDVDKILKEMFLTTYKEFQESSGKEKLPFGRFAVSLAKQIDKDDGTGDDKMIYERIQIRLKKATQEEHQAPLPTSMEQMGLEGMKIDAEE